MSKRYVFGRCKKCNDSLRIRSDYIKHHKGLCKVCQNQGRPYQDQYTRFTRNAKHTIDINYDEFLKFTEIKNCHYCNTKIPWHPYSRGKKGNKSCGYFLDRKDNNLGYSIENCVVCCSRCNWVKGSKLSYEEMIKVGKVFWKEDNTFEQERQDFLEQNNLDIDY